MSLFSLVVLKTFQGKGFVYTLFKNGKFSTVILENVDTLVNI